MINCWLVGDKRHRNKRSCH